MILHQKLLLVLIERSKKTKLETNISITTANVLTLF